MTLKTKGLTHSRRVGEQQFAEILAARQTFLVAYPDEVEATVGDELILRETDKRDFLTGRELLADVTVVREATSAHVVGFRLRVYDAQDLYRRALAVYGEGPQFGQTQEECAELIAAINQYRRGRVGHDKIAEETADVENMCTQMRALVGDAAVDAAKSFKLARFAKRLEAAEAARAPRAAA